MLCTSQDLPRTFPTNVWLATREAQLALERVLLAYSMHNPQVRVWNQLYSSHVISAMPPICVTDAALPTEG